jgi:hypothetical protein
MNKQSKFNWGHGIAIFFSGFVVFMVFLVIKSHQQNIDLVAEDYYAQEIAYGGRMQQIANANNLEAQVSISQAAKSLKIQFPKEVQPLSGTVQLFRPSDKRFDYADSLKLDNNNEQQFSTEKFPRGYYKIKIAWQDSTKPYYLEESIFLQ